MASSLVRRLLPVGLVALWACQGCNSYNGSGPFTPVGGRTRNYGNVVGYGPGSTPVTMIPPGSPGGGGIVTGPGLPNSTPLPSTPNPPPKPIPTPNPVPQPTPGPVPKPVPPPLPVPTPPPANPPANPPADPAPGTGSSAAWAPWPMPPKRTAQKAARVRQMAIEGDDYGNGVIQAGAAAPGVARRCRPMRHAVHQNSKAALSRAARASMPGMPQNKALAAGLPSTPEQDLKYRGGKTLPHMNYVNLYVTGDQAWDKQDIQNIEWALEAAMSDKNLNNVLMQYFNNQPVTVQALPPHPLNGYRPSVVSQGDVEYFVQYLYQQGYLSNFDLDSTLFNFLLPRGTVLNDESARSDVASSAKTTSTAEKPPLAEHEDEDDTRHSAIIPKEDEGDSTGGLGGYHGSIHVGSATIYYSVAVYSERRSDGTANGIPVFSEPWKNVVATLYHELCEARTDPDVEDAVRMGDDPNAESRLGWVSDQGMEIGDFPVAEASDLTRIIQEVPLSDGSGRTVPVQFEYSNAVHGPEGPIPQPH